MPEYEGNRTGYQVSKDNADSVQTFVEMAPFMQGMYEGEEIVLMGETDPDYGRQAFYVPFRNIVGPVVPFGPISYDQGRGVFGHVVGSAGIAVAYAPFEEQEEAREPFGQALMQFLVEKDPKIFSKVELPVTVEFPLLTALKSTFSVSAFSGTDVYQNAVNMLLRFDKFSFAAAEHRSKVQLEGISFVDIDSEAYIYSNRNKALNKSEILKKLVLDPSPENIVITAVAPFLSPGVVSKMLAGKDERDLQIAVVKSMAELNLREIDSTLSEWEDADEATRLEAMNDMIVEVNPNMVKKVFDRIGARKLRSAGFEKIMSDRHQYVVSGGRGTKVEGEDEKLTKSAAVFKAYTRVIRKLV